MASDLGDMVEYSQVIRKYVGRKNMSFHNRICLDIASQISDINQSASLSRLCMLVF